MDVPGPEAMDAPNLARWTRFAGRGGIGRCTAVKDCVQQNPEDLMFLTDDEIVVLVQLDENRYLGYCEGVVGQFDGADVRFHSKLKKPVITRPRRSSAVASNSPLSPQDDDSDGDESSHPTAASFPAPPNTLPIPPSRAQSPAMALARAEMRHSPAPSLSRPPTGEAQPRSSRAPSRTESRPPSAASPRRMIFQSMSGTDPYSRPADTQSRSSSRSDFISPQPDFAAPQPARMSGDSSPGSPSRRTLFQRTPSSPAVSPPARSAALQFLPPTDGRSGSPGGSRPSPSTASARPSPSSGGSPSSQAAPGPRRSDPMRHVRTPSRSNSASVVAPAPSYQGDSLRGHKRASPSLGRSSSAQVPVPTHQRAPSIGRSTSAQVSVPAHQRAPSIGRSSSALVSAPSHQSAPSIGRSSSALVGGTKRPSLPQAWMDDAPLATTPEMQDALRTPPQLYDGLRERPLDAQPLQDARTQELLQTPRQPKPVHADTQATPRQADWPPMLRSYTPSTTPPPRPPRSHKRAPSALSNSSSRASTPAIDSRASSPAPASESRGSTPARIAEMMAAKVQDSRVTPNSRAGTPAKDSRAGTPAKDSRAGTPARDLRTGTPASLRIGPQDSRAGTPEEEELLTAVARPNGQAHPFATARQPEHGAFGQPDRRVLDQRDRGALAQPERGAFSQSERANSLQPERGAFNPPERTNPTQPERGSLAQSERGSFTQPERGRTLATNAHLVAADAQNLADIKGSPAAAQEDEAERRLREERALRRRSLLRRSASAGSSRSRKSSLSGPPPTAWKPAHRREESLDTALTHTHQRQDSVSSHQRHGSDSDPDARAHRRQESLNAVLLELEGAIAEDAARRAASAERRAAAEEDTRSVDSFGQDDYAGRRRDDSYTDQRRQDDIHLRQDSLASEDRSVNTFASAGPRSASEDRSANTFGVRRRENDSLSFGPDESGADTFASIDAFVIHSRDDSLATRSFASRGRDDNSFATGTHSREESFATRSPRDDSFANRSRDNSFASRGRDAASFASHSRDSSFGSATAENVRGRSASRDHLRYKRSGSLGGARKPAPAPLALRPLHVHQRTRSIPVVGPESGSESDDGSMYSRSQSRGSQRDPFELERRASQRKAELQRKESQRKAELARQESVRKAAELENQRKAAELARQESLRAAPAPAIPPEPATAEDDSGWGIGVRLLQAESSESDEDEDDEGSEWDADAIYDDYRYSRSSFVSMASRASRRKSAASVRRTPDGAPPLPAHARSESASRRTPEEPPVPSRRATKDSSFDSLASSRVVVQEPSRQANIEPSQSYASSLGPSQSYASSIGPSQSYASSVGPSQSYASSVGHNQAYTANAGPSHSYTDSNGVPLPSMSVRRPGGGIVQVPVLPIAAVRRSPDPASTSLPTRESLAVVTAEEAQSGHTHNASVASSVNSMVSRPPSVPGAGFAIVASASELLAPGTFAVSPGGVSPVGMDDSPDTARQDSGGGFGRGFVFPPPPEGMGARRDVGLRLEASPRQDVLGLPRQEGSGPPSPLPLLSASALRARFEEERGLSPLPPVHLGEERTPIGFEMLTRLVQPPPQGQREPTSPQGQREFAMSPPRRDAELPPPTRREVDLAAMAPPPPQNQRELAMSPQQRERELMMSPQQRERELAMSPPRREMELAMSPQRRQAELPRMDLMERAMSPQMARMATVDLTLSPPMRPAAGDSALEAVPPLRMSGPAAVRPGFQQQARTADAWAADGFQSRGSDGFSQRGAADAFQQSRATDGFAASRPSEGFQPSRPAEGFQPSRPSDGFQASRGSEGFQPQRTPDGFQPPRISNPATDGFAPPRTTTPAAEGTPPRIGTPAMDNQAPSTMPPNISLEGMMPPPSLNPDSGRSSPAPARFAPHPGTALMQQPARPAGPAGPGVGAGASAMYMTPWAGPLRPESPSAAQFARGPTTATQLNDTLVMAARHGATIRGRTEIELGAAGGPVRVVWSVAIAGEVQRRPDTAPQQQQQQDVRARAPGSTSPVTPPRHGTPVQTNESPDSAHSTPIARSQFSPQVGRVRPRSRSFSGFTARIGEVQGSSSGDESARPARVPSGRPNIPPLFPSPLSLHPNSVREPGSPLAMRSPSSPLAKPPLSPLRGGFSSQPPSPLATTAPRRGTLRHFGSSNNLNGAPPRPMSPPRRASGPQGGGFSEDGHASSVESDTERQRDRMKSPPPGSGATPSRSLSLRSKISLSAMRAKNVARAAETPSSAGPTTPNAQQEFEEDTVHVQDMEFELVRPVVPAARMDEGRMSSDSGGAAKERASIKSAVDAVSLRSESPGVTTPSTPQGAGPGSATLEAYRHRELKWISAMGTTAPAQARKSKKVGKLVKEGPVPASVRGLVWAFLTDSKSRRIASVYAQLQSKGRLPFSDQMVADVGRLFADQPHLREPTGPIVMVLQAYFSMVADVRYSPDLTLIAGQLLLQSPEEDAFWTLVQLMENHLRGYFGLTSVQLEVDANLLAKVVDSADPQLSIRLFADLHVKPLDLCQNWFSSLFTRSLPPDLLMRVWDIFLFDGPIFLFRVALVLLSLCRRQLFGAPAPPATVLAFLTAPPPQIFPPDPETFVQLCGNIKLREDDLRKSRVKMAESLLKEHQMQRRQQQSARRVR